MEVALETLRGGHRPRPLARLEILESAGVPRGVESACTIASTAGTAGVAHPVRCVSGQAEMAAQASAGSYPFKDFSKAYVDRALAEPVDWRAKGLVTPAKDQGGHGYCGTFGRVAAAEGQFARRSVQMQRSGCLVGWRSERRVHFLFGFPDSHARAFILAGPVC